MTRHSNHVRTGSARNHGDGQMRSRALRRHQADAICGVGGAQQRQAIFEGSVSETAGQPKRAGKRLQAVLALH